MEKLAFEGPIVLAILDGVGISNKTAGNAVHFARTPFLDYVSTHYLNIPLQASGEAVGVAKGQIGNSEIGHNTIGSGQIVKQNAVRIQSAIDDGSIWQSGVWYNIIDLMAKNQGATLHFAGIFSDGGVHSDIHHLEAFIKKAYEQGVRKIRIHAVFDGRDVAPQSEPKYINEIEAFCHNFQGADFKIASGAGRMAAVADRYENDWNMVKKGWDMMVHGEATYHFTSAGEGIAYLRNLHKDLQDQNIPPFVIDDANHQPIGKIQDGDVVVYFDFRADRAIEITRAFTEDDFKAFDRGIRPKIYFAGLTEYDKDTHAPTNQLVPAFNIENTLSQYIGSRNFPSLAVSETVKFGHITYYFNGNSYKHNSQEDFLEIPSSKFPFETRPWMKSAEITDNVLAQLKKYRFVRINFPGGDMVGHTAKLQPTMIALEAIDVQLQRLAAMVDHLGGIMIITADHGNAEELLDDAGNPKTAHTTNPVPCIFYDNTKNRQKYQSANLPDAGLANIAATIVTLLGKNDYPSIWKSPLIITQ